MDTTTDTDLPRKCGLRFVFTVFLLLAMCAVSTHGGVLDSERSELLSFLLQDVYDEQELGLNSTIRAVLSTPIKGQSKMYYCATGSNVHT